MTVTLNLKPEVAAGITRQAAAEGTDLTDYIGRLLEEAVLPKEPFVYSEEQRKKNQAAIDLFNEWDEEDKTDDPEEIARRQAEWEEFKIGMNAAHTSNRVIYP